MKPKNHDILELLQWLSKPKNPEAALRIARRESEVNVGQFRWLRALGDAFSQADLVAYPSEYEGFGNAFLEAVYHKRMVLCNRYSIYRTDIEPCGFRAIEFEDYLTSETVDQVQRVLDDKSLQQEMVEHNYEVAREFFSYEVLEDELNLMIRRPHNVYRLVGRLKQFRGRSQVG